jgi:hypothetical protein
MDFSLARSGIARSPKALNWPIHIGYDGSAKAKPGCRLGMTGRDFAAVMTQTMRLPAYRVFFPHIQ